MPFLNLFWSSSSIFLDCVTDNAQIWESKNHQQHIVPIFIPNAIISCPANSDTRYNNFIPIGRKNNEGNCSELGIVILLQMLEENLDDVFRNDNTLSHIHNEGPNFV